MLNRAKRRYFDKRFERQLNEFVSNLDDVVLEIALSNDISEIEARDYVIYSLMNNSDYRRSLNRYYSEVRSA